MKLTEPSKQFVSKFQLLIPESGFVPPLSMNPDERNIALVIGKHRFYNQLQIDLISADLTAKGKLKNPLKKLSAPDLIWTTDDSEVLKFLTAIVRFENNYDEELSKTDFEALKAIIRNPLKLRCYLHDSTISASFVAGAMLPVEFKVLTPDFRLSVDKKDSLYELSGKLNIEGHTILLEDLNLRFGCLIQFGEIVFLLADPYFIQIIRFFKQQKDQLIIEEEQYDLLYETVLSKLENKVNLSFSYLKKATQRQIAEKGFDLENERLIYLSESEDFVLITPVVRYSNVEVPVFSHKQIQAKDKFGKAFKIKRDEESELQFITDIVKQHPFFEEQYSGFGDINPKIKIDCFYIHRKHFLDPEWFLDAFEQWRNKGIAILGFNELKENKINPYKGEIDIKVNSGIDWFDAAVKVKFGNQPVSLKNLHKSIRNKNKFVVLDDGTHGVLPSEWISRFTDYFNAGELVEERIRIEKINFSTVNALFEKEMLDDILQREIAGLNHQIMRQQGPHAIESIPIPSELKATLRDYQKQGLYWLNFLDQFNFGACLADDMGLGKTLQVITFILSQRSRDVQNTNLIVVPASVVFNWRQEIEKFAPSLKVKTLYGPERQKIGTNYSDFEVILTSYGTLLADIAHLKKYRFNYLILDESQNIKNPLSQRYKAAKLLNSRNRIVLTGTPVENNTYDLYGQFSFACPGLLGNREQFKQLYSVPIDQFKDATRAQELQKKISPFILRRTKEKVAKELPEKTEMVIYCEMGNDQREIYDAYSKEIRDYLLGISEDDLPKSAMHVLKGITKLRQICNAPALIKDEKYYGRSSSKMEVLLEQIESKSSEHKILVFSQFVGMLDLIKSELSARKIGFEYLTGQTVKRDEVVGRFQNDASKRVFLISLKAGGVGLNLTQADYVFLVDPWWNPAVENQAIDRSYRIGQDKNVIAVRLICPDTIEDKIRLIQSAKRNLSDNLIKSEASIFRSLTKGDLIKLLS